MLMNQSDIDARILQHTQQVDGVNSRAWQERALRHSSGGAARATTPRARLGSALIALGSRLSTGSTA